MQPTHYVGDKAYFSDTETSSIWEEVVEKENEGNTKGDETKDEEGEAEEVMLLPPTTEKDASAFVNHTEQAQEQLAAEHQRDGPSGATVSKTADEENQDTTASTTSTDGRRRTEL